MDGLQMATILSLDPFVSRFFKGFAWVDTEGLHYPSESPALYILNTDVQAGPGEHWCAVLFEGNRMEFFDPFGNHPLLYNFEALLSSRTGVSEEIYNSACVQNLSSKVCGCHCVFYAYNRCRGSDLQSVLDFYDLGNLIKNDKMVENFVTMFGSGYKIKK